VFTNDGKTWVWIENASGSSMDVTFTAQTTSIAKPGFGTLTIGDRVVTVGAGANAVIGTFPTGSFNNGSGQVAITYSLETSVTVAVIKFQEGK
jgi:hypothetical protein